MGPFVGVYCLHLLDATKELSEFLASSPADSVLWVSIPVGTSRCLIEKNKEKGVVLGQQLARAG